MLQFSVCLASSLSFLAILDVLGRLTVSPADVTTMTGSNATFKCKTANNTQPVSWEFKPGGESNYQRLFYGGKLAHSVKGRVNVKANGVNKLILYNVSSQDGGEYKCQLQLGLDFASAQLTIVGKQTCHYFSAIFVD